VVRRGERRGPWNGAGVVESGGEDVGVVCRVDVDDDRKIERDCLDGYLARCELRKLRGATGQKNYIEGDSGSGEGMTWIDEVGVWSRHLPEKGSPCRLRGPGKELRF
jgi:hypothetical protein